MALAQLSFPVDRGEARLVHFAMAKAGKLAQHGNTPHICPRVRAHPPPKRYSSLNRESSVTIRSPFLPRLRSKVATIPEQSALRGTE